MSTSRGLLGVGAVAAMIALAGPAQGQDTNVPDGPPTQAGPIRARFGLRSTLEHAFILEGEIGHAPPLLHGPLTAELELLLSKRVSFTGTFGYAPSLVVRCTGNPRRLEAEGCGLPFFRGGFEITGRIPVERRAEVWVGGGLHLLRARTQSFGEEALFPSSDWSTGIGFGPVVGANFHRGAASFGPLMTLSLGYPMGSTIGIGWRVSVGHRWPSKPE